MEEIKITNEYLLKLLNKIYKERHNDKDFNKLNEQKLKIVLKTIGIEGLINFNYETKKIEFKLINGNYINKRKFTLGINKDEKVKKIEESLESEDIRKYSESTFNDLLKKMNIDMKIRGGKTLCTNSTYELFHKQIQSYKKDYAISSMYDAMKKIYEEPMLDILSILYSKSYNKKRFNKDGWKINESVKNEEDLKILNSSINEYDYI